MADLNALIAQGAQFQAPVDPFAQYGKMQQLQQGQQANQLNQMKMEEMQAATAERNALRQLNPTSPDYESQLSRVNPQLGIAYRKEAATVAAQQATQKAQQAQALKTSLDNHRSFLVGVNDQPSYDAWRALATKNIPELADMLPTAFSPDAKNLLLQTADDISKKLNVAPALSNLAKLRAEKAALPVGDPSHAAYDAAIAKESQFAPHAPPAESPLAKLRREMATLPPGDPGRAEYLAAINKETTRAPAPVVNISNVQEKAEAADYGKLLVKDYDAVKASASLAQKSIPALESNLAILNKGFDTGSFTESKAAAAKVLGALGVKEAEKYATDSQAFLANASAAVLQRQLEQKGPQTEADAQRITQTGAQLGNTKAANEFVLKVAKSQLQRDIEQRDFYAAWRDKNQTFNGAENAWNAGPGSKSLFERPELKAYAAGPNVKEIATDRTKGLDRIFGGKR